MRKRTVLTVGVVTVVGVALVLASLAVAQSGNRNFDANRMSGKFEVPLVSTNAKGSLDARLQNTTPPTISYTLRFENLEGNVTQAHIHFGQKFATGGIMIWLCGTASNPGPAGTPACVQPGHTAQTGVVTGTIDAGDVILLATQAIPAGAFDEAVAALRSGNTYANVHSTVAGPGEIRAQIGGGGGDDDDDDDD
jgi:CHRD domain